MKTTIYYFELENETISIKTERKSKEFLKDLQKFLNAKKVYIKIKGTKLIFEL